MAGKHIEIWEWDEANLGYLGRHGMGRRTVLQVAAGRPRFRRNKRGRSAAYLMIGPDAGGTVWTVCVVEREGTAGVWRAFNGWRSDDEERAWYERQS